MNNASENSWLDTKIPKEAQLSILLVFKVVLLIFYHKHVGTQISYYSDISLDLDSMQGGLFIFYVIEMFIRFGVMIIHFGVMSSVYLFLILAISVNVFAICRIVKQL